MRSIAAIGCSDKSPGVNASTFDFWLTKILSPRQNFVATTCRTKLNQFDFVRHVVATKFCRGDKIFNKILLFTRQNLLLRRVAATCCCDVLQRFVASCVSALKRRSATLMDDYVCYVHIISILQEFCSLKTKITGIQQQLIMQSVT